MSTHPDPAELQAATQRALAVKQAYEQELLSKPNVVGVGVGFLQVNGEPTSSVAVVVMVSRKLPDSQLAPEDRIPTEIDQVPVDVQEVGEITAF